jgi:hypothetical protein
LTLRAEEKMGKKETFISKAYKAYRDQYIQLWNFASMISYAVPALSKTIKGVEEKVENYSMVKSDLFKFDRTTADRLKNLMKGYDKQLAAYLWISNFAFFESFVRKLLDELMAFYSDNGDFLSKTKEILSKKIIENDTPEKRKIRIKLQKPFDGRKLQQYTKYSKLLVSKGYYFPSTFFAVYGIKRMQNDLKEIRAKDIPEILADGFLFTLSDEELKKFFSYKDKRNNIAHGEESNLSIYETVGMFKFFNELAFRIDQHIVHNFMIREIKVD